MKNNSAFTLAEVLITLTIIGVIAALTIPNLMQKYKKYQVEVQIKEAYNILYNAMIAARNDIGISWSDMIDEAWGNYSAGASVTLSRRFGEKYFAPYVKASKVCNGGVTTNGCDKIFPNTDFLDGNQNRAYMSYIGYNPNNNFRVKLNNGMSVGVALAEFGGGATGKTARFYVNINSNGKNQVGKDIFFFQILSEGSGSCYLAHNDNCHDKEIFLGGADPYPKTRTNISWCTQYLHNCAWIIQHNGWKIPDDYPVKKW